jgi:hypothetical protein
MSPRKRMPSGRIFLLPPKSRQVMAFLMSGVRRSPSCQLPDVFGEFLHITHQDYQKWKEQHSLQSARTIRRSC